MKTTDRVYLRSMHTVDGEARLLDASLEEERTVVSLDRSPFHPQGGGQPADHGLIRGDRGEMAVDDVRMVDGVVLHKGVLSGVLSSGDLVHCSVDATRREYLSRIHSAGHVVDMAVIALGHEWVPGRGYHFPDGPYVEYAGSVGEHDPGTLARSVEQKAAELVERDMAVSLRFVRADSGDRALRFVPAGLAADEEVRLVEFGDFAIPCGGTHVRSLAEIGEIRIRKVRAKGDTVRVAYAVSDPPQRDVNDPSP